MQRSGTVEDLPRNNPIKFGTGQGVTEEMLFEFFISVALATISGTKVEKFVQFL